MIEIIIGCTKATEEITIQILSVDKRPKTTTTNLLAAQAAITTTRETTTTTCIRSKATTSQSTVSSAQIWWRNCKYQLNCLLQNKVEFDVSFYIGCKSKYTCGKWKRCRKSHSRLTQLKLPSQIGTRVATRKQPVWRNASTSNKPKTNTKMKSASEGVSSSNLSSKVSSASTKYISVSARNTLRKRKSKSRNSSKITSMRWRTSLRSTTS